MARDDAEYVEFVEAVQDRLRRTAYLMTSDWALAADLTQEALIKVYVAWPKLERKGGLASYARRAVVSAAIDHHRKRARRPEVLVDHHDEPGLGDGSGDRADRALIVQALRKVPDRQRACIVLRYFEDLSVTETASVLKCSEGNVKSQTSHGIAALKRELTALGMPALTLPMGA
ncbi:SigE family RNA polymerase sigma factor [Nocardioides antri]|uniref:SigE family RNA polymerase sigma factor n=1 Tax=Nocardioides antri TaxID=2607659 RepID=A0A5B1M816_9ACTN|nr:SigE family RNA polymerase sigma factor [Nocardioides antri]KAA1428874.1 SigE family RNA polymerase sigma factor [Nocardioides antri]